MKRFLIAIIAIIMLAACSTNDGEQETASEENQSLDKPEEQEEAVSEENQTLGKSGDKIYNSEINSDVELISMSQPNDKIELGPIDMIIEDIKVLQVTNIEHPELLDLIGEHGKDDAFAYVQIAYTMENTGEESLKLNDPIESIIFNTKEQVDTYGNEINIGQDSNTPRRTLHGKVKDELVTGIIINKSDPKDIEDIKIVTGRINDEEGYALIEPKHASYDVKK